MKFSIRTILVVTAAIAWTVATMVVFPPAVASLVLMAMNPVMAAAVLAMAVYGQGRTQALAIGASVPLVGFGLFSSYLMMAVAGSLEDTTLSEFWQALEDSVWLWKGGSLVTWANALLCGVTSLVVRQYLRLKA